MTSTPSPSELPAPKESSSTALWTRVSQINQRINWITFLTAAQVVILGIQLGLMGQQTKLSEQQTALMATQTATSNKVLELENEVSVNVTYGLGEKKALQIINYGATAVFIHGYQYGASPPVFIDSPTIALREQVISFSPLGFEEAAKNGGITGSKAEIRWTPCMLFIKNRLGRKFRIGFNGTATFDAETMEWKFGAITHEIKEFDW